MAGTPTSEPIRFVCRDCHVISAGNPTDHENSPTEYEPPEKCGACGAANFVKFSEFERTPG